MATARDIVTRALKRLGVAPGIGDVSADDAKDVLEALNDMMHSWKFQHVDVLHTDYTLNSAFNFFVPPDDNQSDYYGEPAYQGEWNASTNSPSLGSAVGTMGHVYKVSVAGSTTLDGVSSWQAGDWLVFDGRKWVKGRSSRALEDGVASALAVKVSPDFGVTPSPQLVMAADRGIKAVLAMCLRTPPASFEPIMIGTYSRRIGW